MINQIKELINELNYHTKLYDEGNPVISDKEWDDLYFKLYDLENETGIFLPESPTQSINYQILNELNKVEHNHSMLSLQKTKSVDELKAFIGKNDYVVMLKLDGLTCSLMYDNGKLVSAETRGDGRIGEDVTHNAMVIKNIPKKIPFKGKLIVDGEIICRLDDFKEFSEEYKNARNFAAGSIRLLDNKVCQHRKLSFYAWDVIEAEDIVFETLVDKFNFLIDNSIEVVNFDNTVTELTENYLNAFKNDEDLLYPIDGLVIKYNNCKAYEAAGRTEHHFSGGMAFKFYDEVYDTNLIGIEFTMGRTGILTPVAVFHPVEIDGCEVTRASLHNINILGELLGIPYINQPLKIYKANQIIPQVKSAVKTNDIDKKYFYAPKSCPVCGGITSLHESSSGTIELICTNVNCEGKLLNILNHFCGKKGLDIRGLSKATLEKLIDWEWVKNYEDIFKLKEHREEWISKVGFGIASVDNILEAIESSSKCDLDKFIAALGIPLIGTKAAKDLANEFRTWTNLINAINSDFKFYVLPNFGIEMHNSIINFDYSEAEGLIENYLDITTVEAQTATNSELKDKTIVITGKLTNFKNRDELKTVIESLGGKVSGSISSKTNYLINNDINSTSSKNNSAKKLNIPILSEEQFIEMFGI